jgi:hypothetical protein
VINANPEGASTAETSILDEHGDITNALRNIPGTSGAPGHETMLEIVSVQPSSSPGMPLGLNVLIKNVGKVPVSGLAVYASSGLVETPNSLWCKCGYVKDKDGVIHRDRS